MKLENNRDVNIYNKWKWNISRYSTRRHTTTIGYMLNCMKLFGGYRIKGRKENKPRKLEQFLE